MFTLLLERRYRSKRDDSFEENSHQLDWDHLQDGIDSYQEILFDPDRVIDVRD
jgi:hypothetical protein